MIIKEYQHIEIFFHQVTHQIGQNKFLVSKKLKILYHEFMLLMIEAFYKKELQKTNQTEFRVEQVIKKKSDSLYVKWKGYDNSFNSSIDKKRFII